MREQSQERQAGAQRPHSNAQPNQSAETSLGNSLCGSHSDIRERCVMFDGRPAAGCDALTLTPGMSVSGVQ